MPSLLYKEGVRIRGTRTEVLEGQEVVKQVLFEFGYDCIVTGGIEGSHSETSLHYDGKARDYRSKHIGRSQVFKVRNEIYARLRPLGDFDFMLEGIGTKDEHFHLEWQPKKSAGHL